jgi:phage tail sheath protein FI
LWLILTCGGASKKAQHITQFYLLAMAKEIKTPGVYIEEISKLPPSIAAVETAVPAFIGYTQIAKRNLDNDLDFVPLRIHSLLEYEQYYGQMVSEQVVLNISDTVEKSGAVSKLLERKIEANIPYPSPHIFWYQLQLYFANGGGPCYIVSTGRQTGAIQQNDLLLGLQAIKNVDGITLIIFPEGGRMINPGALYELYNAALQQAAERQDRFVVCDVSNQPVPEGNDISFFRKMVTGGHNNEWLKYGAAYYPYVQTNIRVHYTPHAVEIVHQTLVKEAGKADSKTNGTLHALTMEDALIISSGAMQQMEAAIGALSVTLPPSCGIAGLYCMVDNSRGVWKAPANVGMNGVIAPVVNITNHDQEDLNVTVTGKSINVIRTFIGKGVLVWGARTLEGNSNEWRYVPVRRLCIMIETSISIALKAFAFEPNDANTWVRVQALIENFLTLLWRQGALAGAKPEHAFAVSIGLNKTMTAIDMLEGRMIVNIMLAVTRPAEFIVIVIQQKMAQV